MNIATFGNLKHAAAAPSTKRTGKLGSQLVWPLALACGLLIFLTGSSIYLVASSRFASELVSRALRVETKFYAMLDTLRLAEAGQRGYLLTGDIDYLDIYHLATKGIAPAIADLKAAIGDPAQQQTVADFEPLVQRKFAEMAETIRLFGGGKGEEAKALVRSGVGRALMAEIRSRSLDMMEAERGILSARESSSSSTVGWLLAVNLIGLTFIIALSLISILVMRRLSAKEFAYLSELERSNQELDDFAYIASHDLKEPLRGVFNHASFLLEDYRDKLDEDGVRRLNRLGQLSQRMEQLINDLMYFSRLGRADLAKQEVDLNAVIVDIQEMMETLLSERNARIILAGRLPALVCDKTRVTEAFRNLITNAVKYNDKPEPLVEIGFADMVNTSEGSERNVFYIKDNGIGIERDFHQEIFRIFKRLQAPAAGQEAGSGVGLTFVKKIIERHGGRIWLESEPGQGTTFYFHLNSERKTSARGYS